MIQYRNNQTSSVTDGYSRILREAAEYFAGQRIQMLGSGFEEILSEESLFKTYTERLSRDLTADEAAQTEQLFENARTAILGEASVSNITPISALAMPTIRKMWVKVGLREAVPTEVVKAPKFSISFIEPYLFDKNGNEVALPAALRDMGNTNVELQKLTTAAIPLPVKDMDLMTPLGRSRTIGDAIDAIFTVVEATLTCVDAAGLNPVDRVIPLRVQLELRDNFVGDVEEKHTDGTVTKDVIFGRVDRQKGLLTVTSVNGKVKNIKIDGRVTSESNTNSQSVSFRINTKDVTIGVGAHLNAPLPLEFLQDTMALYQLDAALEVVDLMSNTNAQKLDQEIIQFIDNSYIRNGLSAKYSAYFDVTPPARYAGSPKDWREELKTVFNHLAIKMKSDTAFQGGHFVIISNPIDAEILTNVNWVFTGVNEERGGVSVAYSVGAFSGAQNYVIVTSENVSKGKLRMIYVPGTNKQMTYKYYPYTFNVEKGYIDPNRPYVPSIMMTKRHTIEELIPLAAEIEIRNNDGIPK